MTEPSEDEILVKAKQLARADGRHWLWTTDEVDPEWDGRDHFVDESLRSEYLNRALELLRHEQG
jgi:hypothetical protein